MTIFDVNCPQYFAANERDDYAGFLATEPSGYEVCTVGGKLAGAFGLRRGSGDNVSLTWIMLDPSLQGIGLGSAIMKRVIGSAHARRSRFVEIAASHRSAPFFAKFGASVSKNTTDGWGPGMDRVDMQLKL